MHSQIGTGDWAYFNVGLGAADFGSITVIGLGQRFDLFTLIFLES